jgi:hypothetical protein
VFQRYTETMIKSKTVLVAYKVLFGLLGLTALITEVVALVNRNQFEPGNFFSYFTVESNAFAVILLLASAVYMFKDRTAKNLFILRGAATLYMVITGIVFSVLLSKYESATLTAVPWDNTVLHYIMPVAVLVDWLIEPAKNLLAFRKALVWLSFPIAYMLYSLVRGSITGWYPYPFLNPSHNGYTGLIVTSIGIAVLATLLTWLLVSVSNKNVAKTKR